MDQGASSITDAKAKPLEGRFCPRCAYPGVTLVDSLPAGESAKRANGICPECGLDRWGALRIMLAERRAARWGLLSFALGRCAHGAGLALAAVGAAVGTWGSVSLGLRVGGWVLTAAACVLLVRRARRRWFVRIAGALAACLFLGVAAFVLVLGLSAQGSIRLPDWWLQHANDQVWLLSMGLVPSVSQPAAMALCFLWFLPAMAAPPWHRRVVVQRTSEPESADRRANEGLVRPRNERRSVVVPGWERSLVITVALAALVIELAIRFGLASTVSNTSVLRSIMQSWIWVRVGVDAVAFVIATVLLKRLSRATND